ncbi:MAG: DNA-3-methyladenine glycosylase, partial [Microbacteriaceae bacterium]|nr:DNA-3-methyladenine glycosylase [Microbacteriaceae bacterium]
LARGPARLTVALGITLADGGADLFDGDRIRLSVPERALTIHEVAHGPRTGVAGAGGSGDFPWRFWIKDDPTVSQYRLHVPKRALPAGSE